MLPLRIRLRQIMDAVSQDPASFRKQISFVLILALFTGLVMTGRLSLTIRIGDSGDSLDVVATDSVGTVPRAPVGPSGGAGVVETPGGPGAVAAPTGGGTRAAAAEDGDVPPSSAVDGGDAAVDPDAAPAIEWQGRCAGGDLRATDQGVSEEEIKLGLMTVNLAFLEAIGFGLGAGDADPEQIMDAWMNELNTKGGVACRQVTYVRVDSDLDEDNQVATCKRLTQDEQVFAVLSPGGNVAGAPCIAKDSQTPLITALAAPQRWADEGAPYLWDVLMTQERYMRNQVRWLVEAGEVTPGDPDADGVTRIGVVYADEPYSGPSVENAMLGEMGAQGITPVRVAKLSRDLEQAAIQVSQVVADFQAAGVEHVIMPTNLVYKTQFMQQAEQQNYYPTYSEADYTVGCQNFVTNTYPADSWHGTKCLTAGLINGAPNGLSPDGLEEYLASNPFAVYADAVYLATHPDGYDDGDRDEDDIEAQRAVHYLYGTLILMWAQAADRVGADLTRPAWGQAMADTGDFHRTLSPHPFSYGPGKTSGPDHVHIVWWSRDAGDGYEGRTYRALSPPFVAYY